MGTQQGAKADTAADALWGGGEGSQYSGGGTAASDCLFQLQAQKASTGDRPQQRFRVGSRSANAQLGLLSWSTAEPVSGSSISGMFFLLSDSYPAERGCVGSGAGRAWPTQQGEGWRLGGSAAPPMACCATRTCPLLSTEATPCQGAAHQVGRSWTWSLRNGSLGGGGEQLNAGF